MEQLEENFTEEITEIIRELESSKAFPAKFTASSILAAVSTAVGSKSSKAGKK
ncbi:MAG: hypothetical protein WBJ10_10660 [Daejeonella sp.]|uniref:hypothetical protein n=1 Tax=Daejeonella sp. TaxID=2805397 RepID=UPI003C7897D4